MKQRFKYDDSSNWPLWKGLSLQHLFRLQMQTYFIFCPVDICPWSHTKYFCGLDDLLRCCCAPWHLQFAHATYGCLDKGFIWAHRRNTPGQIPYIREVWSTSPCQLYFLYGSNPSILRAGQRIVHRWPRVSKKISKPKKLKSIRRAGLIRFKVLLF